MDQLLEEARSAYANENIRQEAQAIAEEFLPIENEMLENAEGRIYPLIRYGLNPMKNGGSNPPRRNLGCQSESTARVGNR